ncbi:MAG: hypothetical protein Q7J12_05555 [Syntrophales bacterium]|nr:hypothetical protein [Syntrophales bacterium]
MVLEVLAAAAAAAAAAAGDFKKGEPMTKIPKKPEEIFAEITDDFRKIFGDDLLSIILYGSGAGHGYVPGKSEITFLLVLSEEGIDDFGRAIAAVARWKKRGVAVPLFMTKAYITSSLDSYPVEFLNIKKNYRLVYGENILDELSIAPSYLRLQVERELKGKLLLLRAGFLETEGRIKHIRRLIEISLPAFISIFNALLYLKNLEIPWGKIEVIIAVSKEFSIDPGVFLKCTDIEEGEGSFSSSDIQEIFRAYLREVKKLSKIVDGMKI